MKQLFAAILSLFTIATEAGKPRPEPLTSDWILIRRENYNYPSYNTAFGPGILGSFPFTVWKNPIKSICYLVTQKPPLIGDLRGKTVSMTGSITSSPDVVWTYGSATGEGLPPHVRFFMSTVTGYDVGDGVNTPEKYWWSNPVKCDLAPNGAVTLTTTVNPENWSHALGQPGNVVPDKFDWAAQRIVQIGIAFCAGSFFDIGIAVKQGTWASFDLNTFTIE
jgi:hypothetical protein